MTFRFPWLVAVIGGLYILLSHVPKRDAERFFGPLLDVPSYGDDPVLHIAKLCVFLIVIVAVIKLLVNRPKGRD